MTLILVCFLQKNVFTIMCQCIISMLHNIYLLLFATDYRSSYGSGAVILDDCNFHESVQLNSFDIDRTLTLVRVHLQIHSFFFFFHFV